MCDHENIIHNDYGTFTCANCSMHFGQSFYTEPVRCSTTKSSTVVSLERIGVNDKVVLQVAEKIFNIATRKNVVKGANKTSILCASLYYAYFYLNRPTNFEDVLNTFNIKHKKNASKGLKICQIAIQSSHSEDVKHFGEQFHSFTDTYKQNLQTLILKYNIPLKNYDQIEKLMITVHLKKNKSLNNKVTKLWISCIFFWLSRINPYIDPEEFISIENGGQETTLARLKSDIVYMEKHLGNLKFVLSS